MIVCTALYGVRATDGGRGSFPNDVPLLASSLFVLMKELQVCFNPLELLGTLAGATFSALHTGPPAASSGRHRLLGQASRCSKSQSSARSSRSWSINYAEKLEHTGATF